MISIRTDLAIEAKQAYTEENKRELDGVRVDEENDGDIKVTTVTIESDEAGKELGKPKGHYITIDFPEFTSYDGECMNELSMVVGKVLKRLADVTEEKLVLVVGLGNWNVTPDALGPKVVEKIMVTRHIKQIMPDALESHVRSVCALAPGVLGITGIETGEIVKAVVEKVKPDLVICIDALGSRKLDRVNRTIQIGDTGISPGAGVAATIANDTIDMVLDDLVGKVERGKEFYSMLQKVDKNEKQMLIREILTPFVGELIVTPKDIDTIIESLAKIIADGINIAVQPEMEMEEINKFLN